jgi:hypothetical protein
MHELIHIVGLCPDSLFHTDLLDFVVANYNNIIDINFNQIKTYVTKRKPSHTVS